MFMSFSWDKLIFSFAEFQVAKVVFENQLLIMCFYTYLCDLIMKPSILICWIFLSRCEPLSVASPDRAPCWDGSDNTAGGHVLHTWAVLAADAARSVSGRDDQEHLLLTRQRGACLTPKPKLKSTMNITYSNTLWRLFDLQSSKVKLWWPNGHGDQPFYQLTVRGSQDGSSILSYDCKVRGHSLNLKFGPLSQCIQTFARSSNFERWFIWSFDSKFLVTVVCGIPPCRCISVQLSWSRSPSLALQVWAFISASMGNRFSSKAPTGSQPTRF